MPASSAPPATHADRQQHRREVRLTQVIDTAAHLFAERGYGNVGVAELCERVGLGRGHLYSLIGSKENLLKLIHDRFVAELFAGADRVGALDLAPVDRLRELLRDLVRIIAERHDDVRVFFSDERVLSAGNRAHYRAKRRRYQAIVEDVLNAGVADGSFAIADTQTATRAILGMANSTHEWLRPETRSPREVADAVCDLLLSGILAAPHRPDPPLG